MFSRLDPLFKAQMRHTETLDTRQGIRRQEQQDGRPRRDGNEGQKDDGDIWEDQTNVSVRALRAFLQQLLAGSEESNARDSAAKTNLSGDIQKYDANRKPHAPQAAKAAQAYQRTDRAVRHDSGDINPAALPGIQLHSEEIRLIHRLVGDLRTLEGRNIETLTLALDKEESFLQSLLKAVKLCGEGEKTP